MFKLGASYTRKEIHARLRGSMQSYLPNVGGRVVCACLRLDTNPDAPAIILPGKGAGIEHAAALLINQRTPVPTFLKRKPGCWEYVGEFVVQRYSYDPAEVAAQARRSNRSDISMVIHMVPCIRQPRAVPNL
jgi:hypothetical protein